MDYLWTPWRYKYMEDASKNQTCVFCHALSLQDDRMAQIVLRGEKNFVILNRYPYTTGHVMVVPYVHADSLTGCDPDTLAEMMRLTQRVQTALDGIYHPQGFNIGMNIGRAAGAGVVGHIHMHVLPRWIGDSNFMTTVGETRVEPEDLSTTYEKIHSALHGTPIVDDLAQPRR
jgi:ATP adenylyltransferase